MSTFYLWSGATGGATGADWTNAFTTLTAALAAMAASDTLYVASDHSETLVASTTYTFPGGQTNPNLLISADRTTGTPPTPAAGAAWQTNGTFGITLVGSFYAFGCTFNVGSGSAGTASLAIGSSGGHWVRAEGCKFQLLSSGSSSVIQVGTTGGNPSRVEWVNSTVRFGAVAQSIQLRSCRFEWIDTPSTIAAAGSVPTNLFSFTGSTIGDAYCHGLDLSLIGTGKNLVSITTTATASRVRFDKCILGSGYTTLTGTYGGPGGPIVELVDCDTGTETRHYELVCGTGTVSYSPTTSKASSPASEKQDGSLAFSIVLIATAARPVEPLESPDLWVMNEATGAAKTISVDIAYDSTTGTLTANDVWLEAGVMGDSGDLRGAMSYTRPSGATTGYRDFLLGNSGSALPSGASWSNVPGTPATATLSLTVTPQQAGPIRCRVCVGKNRTVYVDPRVQVA